MFFTDFLKYIMTANWICFKNYFMEVPPLNIHVNIKNEVKVLYI